MASGLIYRLLRQYETMSIHRNTLINFVGSGLPILISLLTVPLYLRIIGEARYGVLAIVWLFLGYFGLFDMGVGKATANQIARLCDAPASERQAVFWTGLIVNGVFGIFGGVILWGGGHYFLNSQFGIQASPRIQHEVLAALPWLALGVPIATLSTVFVAALEGRERFSVLNGLQVVGTAMFQTLPLVVAWKLGPELDGLIAAAVGARLATALPLFSACRRHIPLRDTPEFRGSLVTSLFRYGGWITITAVISPILVSLDRVLIGAQIGAQAVAHYTIPYNLVTKFWIFPVSLTRALFPRFSSLNWDESSKLSRHAVLSLAAVMTPLIITAMFMMMPFLTLWVGPQLAEASAPVAEIILIGVWVNSLAHVPFHLLQGQGRPDVVATFHALELMPYVAILWVALDYVGVQGAAWAWVLRVTVDTVLLFFAVGLMGQISRDIWPGLGLLFMALMLLLMIRMGAYGTVDSIPVRVSMGGTVLFLAICWSLQVAPIDLRQSLARILLLRSATAPNNEG